MNRVAWLPNRACSAGRVHDDLRSPAALSLHADVTDHSNALRKGRTTNMTDPLFRANKRRKVFRKRKDDGEEAKEQSDSEAVQQSNGEDHEVNQRLRALRKPAARKHGIGFTSSNAPRSEEHDENEDREMMPMHPERQQHIAQADRFVKPTGRIAVGEDKHMYVTLTRSRAKTQY